MTFGQTLLLFVAWQSFLGSWLLVVSLVMRNLLGSIIANRLRRLVIAVVEVAVVPHVGMHRRGIRFICRLMIRNRLSVILHVIMHILPNPGAAPCS